MHVPVGVPLPNTQGPAPRMFFARTRMRSSPPLVRCGIPCVVLVLLRGAHAVPPVLPGTAGSLSSTVWLPVKCTS